MSRRSERIQRLVELARRRAEHAAAQLGAQQQRQQQAQTLNQELSQFRHLYGEQSRRPGQVLSAGSLWNSHQFLQRIDHALGQQQLELQRQDQHRERLRTQWLQAKQRTDALQRVAHQLQQQASRKRQQFEQNQLDDISSQRFLQRPND